ncbi:MAG: HAMP domain-containing sensor histidine kinase [Acidobacteriota bacterium]
MAAICILDDVGILTSWNEGASPLLGAAAEVPEAALEKAAHAGICETEWSGVRGLIQPLHGRRGELMGYSVELWDMTGKRARESRSRELVSMVSHELRTPLTAIRGALGLMAAGVLGVLPEKAQTAAVIAERNSERLVRIVNDILDLEKFEAGKLTVECAPVDLDELLRAAAEANQPYGDKFGVRYALEGSTGGVRACGDSGRLMQVLGNLMSNAAKFSPAGSVVALRMERLPEGRVRMEVEDRGAGIPEEFREQVFQRFAQAGGERASAGAGLGLSISRALVEAMGGQIGFETMPGRGTTFYVELNEAGGDEKSLRSSSEIPQAPGVIAR